MMNIKAMNRYQASLMHLLVSGVVALLSSALVFLLWYPGLLAYASGVLGIYLMLIGVDVALGPLITLIVFNPKKKELRRDLLVVVLLQIAGLLYGLHTVYIARPVYVVFVVDRFEVVYANDVLDDYLAKARDPAYQKLPWLGPKTIAARLPTDSEERKNILFSAVAGGPDVHQMPQYYEPYEESKVTAARRAQSLTMLKTLNVDKAATVDILLAKYENLEGGVGFVPLKAKVADLTVIVDTKSGAVLETVDLMPWR